MHFYFNRSSFNHYAGFCCFFIACGRVGDKLEDMQAAAAANVGTKVLVRTGKPITPEAENAADWVLNSLADLPQAIKKQQKPA